MSKAQFDEAVKIVQTKEAPGGFKISPTTDEQLVFYKYYKQATVGDVDIQRPSGFLDFSGKAKWDAWSEVKGISKEEAMQAYVKTLKEILGKSDHEQAKAYIAQIDAAA